jgi:hypothetical protein
MIAVGGENLIDLVSTSSRVRQLHKSLAIFISSSIWSVLMVSLALLFANAHKIKQ